MIANHNPDGLLILDVEGAPRFKEFVSGVGYPDDKGHETYANYWYVVMGVQEDGDYAVVAEGSTKDIHTLGHELTDWKDRLFIKRIFVGESQPTAIRILRDPWQIDGLAGYASNGKSLITRQPKWVHQAEHWASFRDRNTIASVIAVPTDVEVGYSLLVALHDQKKIGTRTTTPRVEWVLNFDPPLNDIFRHPLMQALSHCICRLEKEKNHSPMGQPKPRYGDKRR